MPEQRTTDGAQIRERIDRFLDASGLGGRNPRVVTYQQSFGPSASYYAWEAAGRPVHGVRGKV